MGTASTEFSAKERLVASNLGISRNVIRELRNELLHEGTDWTKQGREIMYAPCAVQRLQERLSEKDGGDTSAQQKNGASDAQCASPAPSALIPDVKKALVTQIPKNRQIIMADLDGESIRIRVRDSKNFVVGMEVKCCLIQEDLYELDGRCPRERGVW